MAVQEVAFAYPSQISLSKGQILLLSERIPFENVLIIQQQQFGGVLAGSGPTAPLIPSSMTAPALSRSFDALSLEYMRKRTFLHPCNPYSSYPTTCAHPMQTLLMVWNKSGEKLLGKWNEAYLSLSGQLYAESAVLSEYGLCRALKGLCLGEE